MRLRLAQWFRFSMRLRLAQWFLFSMRLRLAQRQERDYCAPANGFVTVLFKSAPENYKNNADNVKK